MPWGVAASVAGAAVSSALAPSPSSGGGSSGQYYSPTGLGNADTQWQGLQTGNYNTYYGNNPGIQGLGQQSLQQGLGVNNAYSPAYQNAANAAGSQYTQLGGQLQGAAGQDFAAQGALGAAGQQVMNTAFDPQSALYNRTAQQLQDQTGATNSMYGLGSSGAGAGVANQAMSNFNIDWQNQQLQRQTQGLQAYGAALGQGSTIAGQGGALGNAGAAATLQGGQTPYSTAGAIAAQPGNLGNTYGQYLNSNVYGPAQSMQSQAIPYMNYGAGAQSVPYQNAYNNAQATGGAIGSAIQGIGSNPQMQSAFGNLWSSSPSTQGYFGSTGSAGNYGGTGYGGYGMGSGASSAYTGAGNTYGFTM
jgi:hypothetical protein